MRDGSLRILGANVVRSGILNKHSVSHDYTMEMIFVFGMMYSSVMRT